MTLTLAEKNKIKEVILDLQTSEDYLRRAIDRLNKLVGWDKYD